MGSTPLTFMLRTDKIIKPKESGNKTVTRGSGIITRGSGMNNMANVKWAKGTKEGNREEKVSK